MEWSVASQSRERVGSDQPDGTGSLWSLLQDNYLTPHDLQGTPRDYVEHQINQQLARRMGKPHHSSLLIGDLNGRLAKTDPGSGPVILDNICSKGWIPFLSTATKGTSLHPVRTFWRGKGGVHVRTMHCYTEIQRISYSRVEHMCWRS